MEYTEFIDTIKNVKGNRTHKISNSYGVYDAFKFYRKNKPKQSKFVLTESQYFAVIRKINQKYSDKLQEGFDIEFPEKMGKIELRKYILEPRLDEQGKLIYKAPIDWDATLKLWFDSEEDRNNKTLVKIEAKESFKVLYNKHKANYNNKAFYTFHLNRTVKKKISQAAKDNLLDAFTYK